ncbi:hypothetical protein ACRE_089100 [Hapsidospora chrysogenum ATCC 11550]|uniref:Uncharacterized protein n=1 Tax=Hapsidospora chrysogenum (strain ATCC 11550 / CBS 779.69 / DSM 880 / IAM 14645 / JCM 23072 / IMI 49137) TaxID=857340 RepID=A0A086STJ3_HAPC1|nr:hypothetical protein ACRE_089100 [Hapsidospora chrysogenum ATCC 11550]
MDIKDRAAGEDNTAGFDARKQKVFLDSSFNLLLTAARQDMPKEWMVMLHCRRSPPPHPVAPPRIRRFIFPWQPASNCQSVRPVGGPSNGLNAGMPSSHSSGSGSILPLPFSTCLFGASLSTCQRASLRSASGVTCELVAFPLRGKDVR